MTAETRPADSPDPAVCPTCCDTGRVEIPEPDGSGLYDQACPDCDTPYPVTGDPDAEDPFADGGMVLTADARSVENVNTAWAETFAHLTDPDKPQKD